MLSHFRKTFGRLLETIVIILLVALTVIVVVAVVYRKAGASLSWYDEVAEVLLAWLTYYGAALAALNRAHLGFPGLVNAMKPWQRIPFLVVSEAFILGFFVLLAWVGLDVLRILKGDTLVALTMVPTRLTQSVIPIGAALFIIAEVLTLPDMFRQAKRPDGFVDHDVSSEAEGYPESITEVPGK